jgi:hypothetical protein
LAHVGATLFLFHLEVDVAAIPAIRPYKTERERGINRAACPADKAQPINARKSANRIMETHNLNPQDTRRPRVDKVRATRRVGEA